MHRKGGDELRGTGKENFSAENHNKIERYKYIFPYYLSSRENDSYSKSDIEREARWSLMLNK